MVWTPGLGALGKEGTKCRVLLGWIVSCWVTQQQSKEANKQRREGKWKKGSRRKGSGNEDKKSPKHPINSQNTVTNWELKCSHQMSLWKGFLPTVRGSPVMMEYCNLLFNHLKSCYYFMCFGVLSVVCSCKSSCRKYNTVSALSHPSNQA